MLLLSRRVLNLNGANDTIPCKPWAVLTNINLIRVYSLIDSVSQSKLASPFLCALSLPSSSPATSNLLGTTIDIQKHIQLVVFPPFFLRRREARHADVRHTTPRRRRRRRSNTIKDDDNVDKDPRDIGNDTSDSCEDELAANNRLRRVHRA